MFYLIDKPAGISSFDVIRKLRKILNIKKMGHTGTLDPFATGCLLIATENSTKLIPLLESSQKEYYCTIALDGKTESLDTETEVVPVDTSTRQNKSDEEIIQFLLSQKLQYPPLYSAIHIDGKRAYEKARNGDIFTINPRAITVHEAEVIDKTVHSISLRLIVSSGCYIRAFAPVIGKFLGIEGGYLSELRRTKIFSQYGEISLVHASNFDQLSPISYSILFHTIPTFEIPKSIMKNIIDGKPVSIELFNTSIQSELFFLSNIEIPYISLCEMKNNEVIPVRNNV